MKIVQIGVGAVACIMLSSCSGLLTDQNTGECYELAELSDREKAILQVDNGNPILLVGSRKFVCSCYQGRVVGVGEEGRVIGVGEKGRVVGVGEESQVVGVGEAGHISSDFSKLSCRVVPECSGYQLIGYPPEQIDISIGNRRKSISTDCIIW